MKRNIETIQEVVDYIDKHLEEDLSLDSISKEVNYSKYHLSRLLVFSDKLIMEIALFAGYETAISAKVCC